MLTTPSIALGRPRHGWRRGTLLLLGLFLCRGVVLLCVLPPLEGWDEYQHLAYIVRLVETGQAPVFHQSFVSESLLAAVAHLPQPHGAVQHLGPQRAVDYGAFWSRGPVALDAASQPPVPLYEAQHGSLYYRLAAPLFAAAGGTADLRTSVAALRLANVLLLAGAFWLVLGALRRACPDSRDAALLGLLVALHPYFLVNGARVANDALGVFLGTVVVVGCLAFDGGRLWRRAALLGLLMGFAVLAKAVNLALLPLVALWAVALVVRGKASMVQGWGAALLAGAVFLAVAGPYFAFNLAQFGILTPTQEAIANRAAGRGFPEMAAAAVQVDWPDHLRRIWLSDNLWSGGWSFLLPWEKMRRAFQLLTGFALLGLAGLWARRARRRLPLTPWPLIVCLCVCLSFAAGLAFHAVQCVLAWGRPLPLPHYAAAAWPWFLALVYAGGACWSARRLKIGLAWLLAAIFLLTELRGVFIDMVRTYAGRPLGPVALQRLAFLHPAFLGTPTLLASVAGAALFATAAVVKIAGLRRPPYNPPIAPPAGLSRCSAPEFLPCDAV